MDIQVARANLLRLHDSVLVSIHLDWDGGVTSITVRSAAGPVRIEVAKTRLLRCPRKQAWGRSVCIDACRLVEEDEGVTLSVEMQSGDAIVISGASISVE